MANKIFLIIIVAFLTILLLGCTTQQQIVQKIEKQEVKEQQITNGVKIMKLTSPVFENDGKIPSKYTCDGLDVNPPLAISNVPANAKSLVLLMDDPDAIKPAGKVWDHWIVWNIPPETTEIPEGQEPQGVHGTGTSGNLNYHGPCPPDAEHRYHFKLFALDIELELAEGATKVEVEQAMEGHVLEKTELVGRYERT